MHRCKITERGSDTTSSAHEQAQSLRAMMEHNQLHDPLHNIPPEIVSSIFRFSGEPDSADRFLISNTTTILDESLRRCRWPLELSSVCARWRSIALSDPRLWTTIAMYRRGEMWTLLLELVQQRVSRCGSLAFQLSLWWDTETQTADENFVSLIKFLCARCTRWKGLILRVPSHVIPFFKHNATHTLDLELFHIDTTDDPNLDHFWDMENTVIRPRNATFMGLATLPKSSSWSNLVKLCLTTVRVCDLLPITSQCKNIKSLELTFRRTRPSDMNQLPVEPLTLPHLTKLFIVFAAPLDLNFFMTFTRLPVLRYLVMFYLGDGERHFDLSILQNAMAPCKTLRSIYFQNMSFASEDLLRLLSRFQHLKVLRFVNTAEKVATVPWLDALFDRLTISLSDSPRIGFLPRLIYFDYIGPKAFSWSAVADILEAHIKTQLHPANPHPGRLLMHFNIELPTLTTQENCEYIDKEILLRFLGLAPHWMDISIDEKLICASLSHHSIERPPHPIFRPCKDLEEFLASA